MNVSKKTSYMVKIAFLSAIALVLAFLEFPIFPSVNWLKLDPSDLPALIGAFAFGPGTGVIVEAFKNVLLFFFKGTSTGGIGEFANFIIGALYVGTAGLIYKRKRTRSNAVIALIIASLVMTIVAVPANKYIWIPLFKQMMPTIDNAWITNYLISVVIPFNLIKSISISAITVIIYKKISILLNAENANYNSGTAKKSA